VPEGGAAGPFPKNGERQKTGKKGKNLMSSRKKSLRRGGRKGNGFEASGVKGKRPSPSPLCKRGKKKENAKKKRQ